MKIGGGRAEESHEISSSGERAVRVHSIENQKKNIGGRFLFELCCTEEVKGQGGRHKEKTVAVTGEPVKWGERMTFREGKRRRRAHARRRSEDQS